ncbi:hypothetical protein NM688_g4864 [Phlebia brevispora]|uniref:Uncharacterized protein n=1 Tax=Phlebia brevispora TaxID=194682 RepID=A0ACC1T1V4_9APHY|nr:hypothetical protein NM688_g4864 [Phlebia brevispora]
MELIDGILTNCHRQHGQLDAEGSEAPHRMRMLKSRTTTYGRLKEHELWWRDHQPWLKERGYQLRPRYHPDWKPSWEVENVDRFRSEDAISTLYGNLLDATRVSDGTVVMLKRISDETHPYELEVLDVPEKSHLHVLVMPLLRPFNDPHFETAGEAVDYFQQVFEGMQFIHQCHVAHRDCMDFNIMMDPAPMYPNLYHPQHTLLTRDRKHLAKHYSRTRRPTKYYFIDFGLSGIYNPADGPTIDRPTPHDVYPTDIYYIGNMICETFLQKCTGLEFMKPLVDDMVQDDPKKRLKIDEVLRRFAEIRRPLLWWRLRAHLVEPGESGIRKAYRATKHVFRTIRYIVTLHSAIPNAPK